jgi:endonuclease/exonuclease/phosphatase family metal-dependent hydrolase
MTVFRSPTRASAAWRPAAGAGLARTAARSQAAAAIWTALALAGAACTATNFLDPEGPRYYETDRSAKPAAATRGPGADLLVVSFNIEFGREIEGALSLFKATDALRHPDILLLQEMSGSGVVRMAAGLGMNYLYFPSGIHPQARQEYGTAILSPWPIEAPSKLPLPYGAVFTGMRRAVTAATTRWRDHPVRVYSVHLPARMAVSAGQRRQQVALILDAARRDPGPAIVAGDFNSPAVDGLFEQEGFEWVTRAIPGTARFMRRWYQIDHVFARGLRAADDGPPAGYVDAPGISDHRAIWARLRITAPPVPP